MAEVTRAPHITIIGIGNTLMGDDGVGVAVVRGLPRDAVDSSVMIVLRQTARLGLIKHFREADMVIVVDAIATQAEPGTIFPVHPRRGGYRRAALEQQKIA